MKVIDMKIQQQLEQVPEGLLSNELQTLYQDFYQKLRSRESFTEAEKQYLQEKKPEFYKMAQSLEREVEICGQKLEHCKSKEEVGKLREDYQAEITLGLRSMESNPMLPWEKRLEYTMFKDTKISIIEELIENFVQSGKYKELPSRAEGIKEERDTVEKKEETPSGNAELYAKAKAGYVGVGLFSEKEEEKGFLSSSFEAKG